MMGTRIENRSFSLSLERFESYMLAVGAVAALTGIMLLIGREVLGEGVIALIYLVPISWSTARWGQGPGIAAAISAALAFNFFFIPPYYTLYIGSLEGWLLLGIFLVVAIVVVGRIQSGFARALVREREAVFMYELSASLAGAHTEDSIARILAAHIQQVTQAAMVEVFVAGKEYALTASSPSQGSGNGKPDLIIPILAAYGLAGEIRLWQGSIPLLPADSRLLLNFANQSGLALERARMAQDQVHLERIG
jgi:two-component system sensor histidine kinase KdpD